MRESEEKFRALFEGTSQAVVLHDENGIFEANPSWLRLLGYHGLEDVIGKNPAELSAPIQPGGERAETLAREYIAKALADGSARFEWIVLRRDGTEVPIEVLLTPIQLGGRQLIQAVCNDITERKRTEEELRQSAARLRESEARFSTAFRASPLNITILRLSDAKFIEANDAFVNWLGLGRDRIIGHDSRELGMWLNPEDPQRWEYTPSVRVTRELVDDRMFPVTIQGLDGAIAALRRPLGRTVSHVDGELRPGAEPPPPA